MPTTPPRNTALNVGDAFDASRRHLRTIRDVLRFAVTRFNEAGLSFGHGSDNAFDEAAYLVSHGLSLPLDRLDAFLDARLLPAELSNVLDLLRQRVVARTPAAYLTGEAWLGTFRFRVDERVIVPRSFIAHWLMGDCGTWFPAPESVRSALELCTGSACLAIIMAHVLPRTEITAVDVSAPALAVARKNVTSYGLTGRVSLRLGDLYAGLPRGARYDLIVANPPYVTAAAMRDLPMEYRREPALALDGGTDGLDIVRRILHGAPARMRRGGLLVVEVGHARETVEAAFPGTPFTWLEIGGVDDAVFLLSREQVPAL